MTAGGPGYATTTIVYRVWQYVFAYPDEIGLAAAMSLVARRPPSSFSLWSSFERCAAGEGWISVATVKQVEPRPAARGGAAGDQSPQGGSSRAPTSPPRIHRPARRPGARHAGVRRPVLLRHSGVGEKQQCRSSPTRRSCFRSRSTSETIEELLRHTQFLRWMLNTLIVAGSVDRHQGLHRLNGGIRAGQAADHRKADHLHR